MATTRTVTGTVLKPSGDPWAGFVVQFTLTPATATEAATLPTETISVGTEADGTFSVELVTRVQYEVRLTNSFDVGRSSTVYPAGTIFKVVVPDGEGPVSLETLRAASTPAPGTPNVLTLIDPITADVTSLQSDVTTLQSAKADQATVDTALATKADAATVTALQGTVATKADAAEVAALTPGAGQIVIGGTEGPEATRLASVALLRGDWSIDALSALGSLAPTIHTPVLSYTSGYTTALSSPVEYRPSICGGGSQVTGWDGQNDPNFRFGSGVYNTNNGGNADLALYGDFKPGGAPQAARWPIITEFDTSAGVNAIEVALYGSSIPAFRIEINGMPVTSNGMVYGPGGLTSAKMMTLMFPSAAQRRIKLYMSGGMGLYMVRVPSGQTITKPTINARRGVAIGDSYAGGAGSSIDYPTPGAGIFETFALGILKALGCNDTILAAIGGTGFLAGAQQSPPGDYGARVATILAMNPDVLIVNGTINDGSIPASGYQAAVEAFLDATSTIPERYVIGTMLSGFEANHDLLAASAVAKGVPFIAMKSFLYGSSSVESPNGSGNKDIFQLTNANPHPTFAGHRSIERAIWRQIAALRS
jgi:hypothetical protein